VKKLCVLLPAKTGRRHSQDVEEHSAGVLPSDIYVIDDGSSDGTGDIAQSFDVNVVRNPKNIGKAHSLARLARVRSGFAL
jgi:glycosyltransferase involved in cell wall biosynthesis